MEDPNWLLNYPFTRFSWPPSKFWSPLLLERLKGCGFKQVFDFLDVDKVFPFCSLILESFIINIYLSISTEK